MPFPRGFMAMERTMPDVKTGIHMPLRPKMTVKKVGQTHRRFGDGG